MSDRAFPIIAVPDLLATVRFYQGLGFEQAYQFPDDGETMFVTLRRGDSSIGVGVADPNGDRFSYWVYVDDVDSATRELAVAGAPVVAEPQDQPWGERVAQVRDPAGNLVHLGQALDTVPRQE